MGAIAKTAKKQQVHRAARWPEQGSSHPLGATLVPGGANFSVYSRGASGVELLFFDGAGDARPARVIPLDPVVNRTYHYWHAFVPGVSAGQIYGYRVYGPFDANNGSRFDPTKVLLDAYGRAVVVPKHYSREGASAQGDNAATAMKSVVMPDPRAYDWEGDVPLKRPCARTVIYEMHLRGITAHPNSGVAESKRGTYAGLIEKIPYLRDLGVTAVELLPIFQFDAQDCPPGRVNYWGYAPVSFFAPHQAYSSRQDPLGAVDEFRDMVKALHRADIEVILDVVFNHTAEGDHRGPTLCHRGLDNSTYYVLDDHCRYVNFSGCGNTLNANHPIVRRMIVDSLRYWVEEMHVDGFRFDLASILARDSSGNVMANPPVLWDIESDPVLAGTKMIAEAWDAGGLYQVGSFVGDSWREWNGVFRDDVRDFFRGAEHSVTRVADRLVGSPSIYGHEEREPEQSINFVTCHDGFTLNDLVSYNEKHNLVNGEENRDGADDNRSWNCGIEGPTADPEVEALRNRQIRNFLTVTMISLGVPMILMGDEVRRTQGGNNNAYCQDNESNWFNWSLVSRHAGLHRFVKLLIKRSLMRDVEHEQRRAPLNQLLRNSQHAWHGVKLGKPDWSPWSRSLALEATLPDGIRIHLILNAYWEALDFELPLPGGTRIWRRWIDTTLESPNEIIDWPAAPPVAGSTYHVGPRSVVVLVATSDSVEGEEKYNG
jgi:glycogen operon protein